MRTCKKMRLILLTIDQEFFIAFFVYHPDEVIQFVVAHYGVAAMGVLLVYDFLHLRDERVVLLHPVLGRQLVVVVYPERYPRKPARAAD